MAAKITGIMCILFLVCCGQETTPEEEIVIPQIEQPKSQSVLKNPIAVLRVIDGDTIEVQYQNIPTKIRLQGVNAPELHPTAEPYAVSAFRFTEQKVHQQVELSFDSHCGASSSSCTDVYGRTLAYVTLDNGHDLGTELLNEGLARVYIFKGQAFDKVSDYQASQKHAQVLELGVWSDRK